MRERLPEPDNRVARVHDVVVLDQPREFVEGRSFDLRARGPAHVAIAEPLAKQCLGVCLASEAGALSNLDTALGVVPLERPGARDLARSVDRLVATSEDAAGSSNSHRRL